MSIVFNNAKYSPRSWAVTAFENGGYGLNIGITIDDLHYGFGSALILNEIVNNIGDVVTKLYRDRTIFYKVTLKIVELSSVYYIVGELLAEYKIFI